ncbi:MAG: ROK family protein [Atopobiaceae bacterium]|nr:ROK family protein [Atopobiaceae bacterium]
MANHVAIDVGVTHIEWGLVSSDLTMLERGSVPSVCTSVAELVDALSAIVEGLADRAACVCVSVPGIVDPADSQGTIVGGGRLAYLDGVPLGAELSLSCGLPVSIENNGKAFALGEYAAGALRGSRVGVVLAIGTGIGGGIVVDGRVLRGAHSFAGEFSFVRHTPILGEFRSRDAMAGLCSWQGLRRSILAAKGLEDDDSIDGHQLFAWVNEGDDAALRGLHEYAKDLCTWIFNLQCIVDPDVVAIGGGISVQPALLEALHISMRSMMADLQLPQVPKPNIVLAERGEDAKLLGAVYAMLQRQGV